jgi:hypothetical protein
VVVVGTTMAVGYPAGGFGSGQDTAAVYVFTRSSGGPAGWREVAKLVASDGADGDFFGNDLAVSGDTIAVGAPGANGGTGPGSGAVYVFTKPRGGWAGTLHESAEVVASVGAQTAFGSSVAISGRTIFAAAPYATVGTKRSQGVVFAVNEPPGGWAGLLHPSATLVASKGMSNEQFGTLAVSGDDVFVGEDGRTPRGGIVYVFHRPRGGWRGTLRQIASLSAGQSPFGSVAAAGRTVVAATSAYESSFSPTGTATVYLFTRGGKSWRTVKRPLTWFSFDIPQEDALPPSVSVWGRYVGAVDDQLGAEHTCPCIGRVFVLREPSNGWARHGYPHVRPNVSLTTGGGPNEITLDAQDLFAAATGAVDVYSISGR